MSKITSEHLSRIACVYVRQSTPEQLKVNHESRRLQYALRDRAIALGWTDVMVIDDDLGRSGSGTARPGFERLLANVCRSEVGAVLSVEASRLARNGRDWHTLLEFCALVGTLIIDTDGIYDPRISNDRLLLGMKGTMSEMELSLLRQRSQEALKLKARRGELFTSVAIGYLRTIDGDHIEKDPDQRIRDVINLVFSKFDQLQSVRQVHLWLLQERVDFPRVMFQDGERTVEWHPPRYPSVLKVLSNPIYAGAYAYGRHGSATRIEAGRKVIRRGLRKARDQWDILIKDHHESYISWDSFEHHQHMIADNNNRRGEDVRGAVRRGEALLGGLLRCRHCGRKLHVVYTGKDVNYHCRTRFHLEGPQANCIRFGAHRPDKAVADAVLKVLEPEGLRAAMEAIDARAVTGGEQHRHLELAIEQARFETQRAKRQYDRVDPDNRLVASELERRWNERLNVLRQLEEKLQSECAVTPQGLSENDRALLLELGNDVQRAWHHPGATIETRKRIVRAVLVEVLVERKEKESTLEFTLHWQGGDHTQMSVPRNRTGQHRWVTSADVRSLIEVLARQATDRTVAAILNRSGKRTSHGHTWTEGRVRSFRNTNQIAVYREGERAERGEVTLEEAARILNVDKMRVYRLITDGVIAAQHLCHAAPWIILRKTLDEPHVKQALRARRRVSPVTKNPNQQSLDISTT